MNFYKYLLCVGVGGLVGFGKIVLLEVLCKVMCDIWQLVVVINDIYIKEDQCIFIEVGVLVFECIVGVEIGGCLYMVICEDVLMNFVVVEVLSEKFGNFDFIFVESGGDNLSVIFSLELVDLIIYVIDVVEGEKILCKGGLGIIKFDFLVINKIDFVFYVGVLLEVMVSDIQCMCGDCLWIFINLKQGDGLSIIIVFFEDKGMFGKQVCCISWV